MLKKLWLYAEFLRHVRLSSMLLHLRRRLRTRKLLANGGIEGQSLQNLASGLADPLFIKAAQKQHDLLASTYTFDLASDVMGFIYSGDHFAMSGISEIPWNEPAKIAPSDLNRCFFISFMEFAVLAVNAHPMQGIARVAAGIEALESSARLVGKELPIPWQPLPAARRLANLLVCLSLAVSRDSTVTTTTEYACIVRHIGKLFFLVGYLREDDLGYNHLATEIFSQCLYMCAAGDWETHSRLSRELLECLRKQVGVDGCQLERSATYQAYILGYLDVLMEAGGIAPSERTEIVKMAQRMREALMIMTHPDGQIMVFNDSAIGDGPSPEALGVQSQALKDGVYLLPEGGYARLQFGHMTAILDVGPCGPDESPGHGHADFLAIELSIRGQRFFVDPGVASYKAGPERDWTRSAESHNGPRWEGKEPIEFFGAFRVGRRGRAGILKNPSYDSLRTRSIAGYQISFDHSARAARWIGMWPDAMLVVDAWAGKVETRAISTFLIEGAWILNAGKNLSEMRLTRDDVHAILWTMSSEYSIQSARSFYPMGPSSARSATRLSVIPADGRRTAALCIFLEKDASSRPPSFDEICAAATDMQHRLLHELQEFNIER